MKKISQATLLGLSLGCSSPQKTQQELCQKTIHHAYELLGFGQQANLTEEAIVQQCLREGLSQEQSNCFFSTTDKGLAALQSLRECPAIAKSPPSWLRLPPTEDEIQKIIQQATPPDGPHQTPLRYQQLAGSGSTTCGVTESGALRCWGGQEKLPEGVVSQLSWGMHLCGLTGEKLLSCAVSFRGDDLAYLPKEPLKSFSEGSFHGCGVRDKDGTLLCWSQRAEDAIQPPAGQFTQVTSGVNFSCALSNEGAVTCFGAEAPKSPSESFLVIDAGLSGACGILRDGTISCWGAQQEAPPEGKFLALSCGNQHCCAIDEEKSIACWGDSSDGRTTPPTGRFDVILSAVEHSCASGEGGTACWGKNHFGQTNPPQKNGDPVEK